MTHTTLNWDTIEDKTYACWMGKNVGGTLGGPLEKSFGDVEPFNIDWYPKLQEGGIPNDDLEIQLVSLKALEEIGPTLTAADLAQYWLDHIIYNFDEYGLQKTNLRLGLMPPVSGSYNNWYKHCMGCPIRSEIWACVAPGHASPKWAMQHRTGKFHRMHTHRIVAQTSQRCAIHHSDRARITSWLSCITSMANACRLRAAPQL